MVQYEKCLEKRAKLQIIVCGDTEISHSSLCMLTTWEVKYVSGLQCHEILIIPYPGRVGSENQHVVRIFALGKRRLPVRMSSFMVDLLSQSDLWDSNCLHCPSVSAFKTAKTLWQLKLHRCCVPTNYFWECSKRSRTDHTSLMKLFESSVDLDCGEPKALSKTRPKSTFQRSLWNQAI